MPTVTTAGSDPLPGTAPAPSRKLFWTGWVLSALPALLMLLAGAMGFHQTPESAEQSMKMGWDPKYSAVVSVLALGSAVVYLIPQTAVLGAILLTGYLGGAVATHVRIGDGGWFVAVIVGAVVWLGLLLREPRLWPLLPIRRV